MPVPETYASKITKTDFQNVAAEVNLKLGRAGGETITAAAATTKGLILKGAVSQTANLAEFQDSAGAVLAGIDAAGKGIGALAGTQAISGTYTGDGTTPRTIALASTPKIVFLSKDGTATYSISNIPGGIYGGRFTLTSGEATDNPGDRPTLVTNGFQVTNGSTNFNASGVVHRYLALL